LAGGTGVVGSRDSSLLIWNLPQKMSSL
jgi:hypothetical protein